MSRLLRLKRSKENISHLRIDVLYKEHSVSPLTREVQGVSEEVTRKEPETVTSEKYLIV